MSLFETFSSAENLKKAFDFIQYEVSHSNLAVNPVYHPAITAINLLGDEFFVALERHIREGKYKPEKSFFVYIPKEGLGIRPVCLLSMVDRIVFQAVLNRDVFGDQIDSKLLNRACCANRVNANPEYEQFLVHYSQCWSGFCKKQKKAFGNGYVWKLEVDIQQYYEHIPTNKLLEVLKEYFLISDEQVLTVLESQLRAWTECEGLAKGVPQGADASAVLSNAFLAPLDKFIHNEIEGVDVVYMRYADDMVFMGKSKEVVVGAIEKVVHFLRPYNLTINEKTKLEKLESTKPIEEMQFRPDYDDEIPDITEDDLLRIRAKAPLTISHIMEGDKIPKKDISDFKAYLRMGSNYEPEFLKSLLEVLPRQQSLTVHIIQYIAEGRNFADAFDDVETAAMIDRELWRLYSESSLFEWSKFWILKLLVSIPSAWISGMEEEIERVIASHRGTIFKMVAYYYQSLHHSDIDIDDLTPSFNDAKTNLEKSIFAFFLTEVPKGGCELAIKSSVEFLLKLDSHETNLIGYYLCKVMPDLAPQNISQGALADFSRCLLGLDSEGVADTKDTELPAGSERHFIVPESALTPYDVARGVLGIKRPKKRHADIELALPEAVQWEKVTIKMKEGLREVEILYDGNHLITADHVKLGFFVGKRQQKESRHWRFLCALSLLGTRGFQDATVDHMRNAIIEGKQASRANVYQVKRELGMRLCGIFNTDNSPFLPTEGYYHPRFTILPTPTLRNEELWPSGGHLNDNVAAEVDEA